MTLAFVEHDEGVPTEESLQMLTLARQVADLTEDEVHVGAVGEGVSALAAALGPYGVSVVHPLEADGIETYAPKAWAAGIWQAATACEAAAILAPGTDRGNEVLSHIGAEHDLPFSANTIDVSAGDGYELTRQRWGGSLLEHARLDAEVALMSVALHELSIEEVDPGATASVEPVDVSLDAGDLAVSVTRFEAAEDEGISLKDANIVIGGGRGVGNAENFDILEELAAELGAAVGSSRAAVNEGWRPHDDQIGQTGEKISPTIYIACGISGAVQHMVGCKGSDHILAINTDPEAGIMQKATWAVVGDLHEIIPAVTEEVRKRKG